MKLTKKIYRTALANGINTITINVSYYSMGKDVIGIECIFAIGCFECGDGITRYMNGYYHSGDILYKKDSEVLKDFNEYLKTFNKHLKNNL
jgi:hypothetical protein